MNDPAIVAAWAAAVAAVVGPIISVAMAHWMATQEATKGEASRAIRAAMKDAQDFHHAFLEWWHFLDQVEQHEQHKLHLLQLQGQGLLGLEPDKSQLNAIELELKDVNENLRRVREQAASAFQRTRAGESLLNVDRLSLGLVFEKRVSRCDKAITSIISMIAKRESKPRPTFEQCQSRLQSLILELSSCLKELHESMRKFDPTADI